MVHLIACPDPSCDAPAAVIDRYPLPPTDGPGEMLRTYCVRRHVYTLPETKVYTAPLPWALMRPRRDADPVPERPRRLP